MLRVLEAQAPAKQNATDTIYTLSGRLANASLLEDRRAAILGLRSFAKEYPASVASGALRGLIGSLTKDLEDVDTSKVILETILMLFNPNETSPEASEEIALWLADEFTQRQDNITTLLDLLESPDFYSRLYSLQILSATSTLRPDRLQECVLAAPLGTSRLVGILDDPREAIRSAALLLLTDITVNSNDLQKLVAFENAFDRIFKLITSEGSLSEGGIIVQDCLSFLANLLNGNSSNQTQFRETGFVPKITQLFLDGYKDGDDPAEPRQLDPLHGKNIWGLIAIVRMFLVKGSRGLQANQLSFEKHDLLQTLLDMSFDDSNELPNRAAALKACADMIRGNSQIQERFWQYQVSDVLQKNGSHDPEQVNGATKVYIIDGLLELALTNSPASVLDLRFAACECVKAYFHGHSELRLNFLKRTIEIRASVENEACNVINILMEGPQRLDAGDPYRIWFAAVLTFHLLFGDIDAKNTLMAVKEGDASSGEEVITCIQVLTSHLVSAIQTSEDVRICTGYLMLLCEWLFEDPKAVNDLLGEGSTIQSLTSAISSRKSASEGLVEGLASFLLGILYEFSTKDSPIPRRKLQSIVLACRDNYSRCLEDLRIHPYMRDFEVLEASSLILYFDETFVEFFKDNFSRIKRAIDRDPGLEVANVHEGVDRDLLDSLRTQISEKDTAYVQERTELQTALESAKAELERIKYINSALQTQISDHEKNSESLQTKMDSLKQSISSLNNDKTLLEKNSESKTLQIRDLEDQIRKHGESQKKTESIERDLRTSLDTKDKDLQATRSALDKITASHEAAQTAIITQAEELQAEIKRAKAEVEATRAKAEEAKASAEAKEAARAATQSELDDLLIVLGDLEEKRTMDKERLKALGEETSDVDEDDEAGEDGEDGEHEEDDSPNDDVD